MIGLRSFHVFFIVTALAMFAFLAVWSGQQGRLPLQLLSAGFVAAGLPYLGWFLRKSRTPR